MKYLTRQNDLPNVYASLSKCAQMCMIELAKDKVKKTETETQRVRVRFREKKEWHRAERSTRGWGLPTD